MYKFRSCIFPIAGSSVFAAAVCSSVIIMSSFFEDGLTGSRLLAQEAPPPTEDQGEARQALNQGVQSFNNGQYEKAINEFQRAKLLDPKLLNARLYLATAYASQYIPGAPSEINRELGRKAVEELEAYWR